MRPVTVNTYDLRGFSAAVAALAPRLEAVSWPLVAAARSPAASIAWQGAALGITVRARDRAIARLRALAAAIALARHVYVTVEQQISASFRRSPLQVEPAWAPPGALWDLLALTDSAQLDPLLTASPALAQAVVDGERTALPAGSDAERLASMLRADGGTPGSLSSVHRFLAGLGSRRLMALALLHPTLLARAGSAPPAARFASSRVLVSADLDRLLTRIGAYPPGRARDDVGRRIAQRREWLTGSVVAHYPGGGVSRRRHQLLRFDPRGDGEIVEVLGDLRRARHVAVFVPGTGSDLDRYSGTFARMVPFAAADRSLAVVVWQGADHPDQPFDDGVLPVRVHVLAAAYRDAADAAGPALAADVAGLRIAAPAATADLTVLGHSYGGSIVGSAEAHGMSARRIVHIASAGAYSPVVPPTSAAFPTSGVPPTSGAQHFSMTAYDDPIRLSQGHDLRDAGPRLADMSPAGLRWAAPASAIVLRGLLPDDDQVGHGADPDLLPGVVRLDTGRFDDSCRLVRGHSGMFEPGSTAWRNLLAVMTARPVEVLEPQRWSSHLVPLSVDLGGADPRRWVESPHYVVDRTPWSDPAYRSPWVPTS